MASSTAPLVILAVFLAGSLVLVGSFIRGPADRDATQRARLSARVLAALGVVGLLLAILGLLALLAQPH